MNATLKAKLNGLVEMSKTNGNAADYLHELLRTASGADAQQVRLAIQHAERNARKAGL